ncbi:CocE/NonD family hydrolase [Nocardiopsis chromatogenes]|uniref:CocE/NonD family hydrolase n=1 Tax=Nocardiopsis chromatogenes TaxID=280239 RepID=UPI000349B1F6|nr:CocE/NonD family hydrolase [Nocardiopsis chromatogenes]
MDAEHIRIQHTGPAPVPDAATQYMVPMRDRVRLATDVYLTGDGSPGPVVLIRLPYDKDGPFISLPEIAAYMVGRGYHVVAQDVRGKFRSEGETLLFVHEAADGHDTIDWIAGQPWCDGTVAMWGDSYYGYTQWAAASTGHPALRAIAPRVTGTRLGSLPEPVGEDGAMEVEMSIHRMYPVTFFHDNDVHLWTPDWSHRPYIDNVERFFAQMGARSISFDLWHPDNPVFLQRFPYGHPYDARPLPVLHQMGWWDNCAPWHWQDVFALADRPGWAQGQYLFIDSIDHVNVGLSEAGGRRERTAEEFRAFLPEYLEPALEFFDVFVKGQGSAADIPRVRWNLAHTEGFRTSASWPPEGLSPLTLALSPEGRLVPGDGPGAEAVPGTVVEWTHDPDDLVPSPVTDPFAALREYPDERAWADRPDVLAFDGPEAGDDTDYAGPVRFTGEVGSTGPRMDVFVRLLDVAPDGAAHLVARGQVHLPDTAGGRRVDVDMGQIGYRLRAGHRFRVHVASSDFPEFMPQPGNGLHPWTAATSEKNHQTLRLGGADGARVHLNRLPEAPGEGGTARLGGTGE